MRLKRQRVFICIPLLVCTIIAVAYLWLPAESSVLADDDAPRGALDIAEIYRRVSPSVVSIEVEIDLFDVASGTGFVVDRNGHIVTNAHVIEDALAMIVVFHDGSEASAELIGIDALVDIAVIKVNASPHRLKPVTYGSSEDLAVGQAVLAIGNPFGLEGTLTTGIISGLHRSISLGDGSTIEGAIQTDAALGRGNSGGPLINQAGEVIGVNTAAYTGLSGSSNFGFAIPSNLVKRISENMTRQWEAIRFPTATDTPTDTATPTDTPVPTDGPSPTSTPVPTETPLPTTDTPTKKFLPTPTCTIFETATLVVFTPDENGITVDIIGIDSTDLSQIAIYTSILDASGQLISGLDVGNFAVGGELTGLASVTRVENVSDDDLAFASVLVIDTSSSMADRPLTQVKHAARQNISALGANDPVAIVSFNSQVSLVVDYTTDHDLLLGAIDRLAYGGQTALYDATHLGIEIASGSSVPHRAVVLLSDGGEYGDVSEFTRDESIRAAAFHGVPVFTVGLGWSIDRRFLELISAESNARFYNSPAPESLITIFENLAYLFRTQYIVTISAEVPADGRCYDFTLNVTTRDG